MDKPSLDYTSLMEKKAQEWEAHPQNGGPRPEKVDFEIEKLSKELHELTTQEKEITRKRIDILNRLTATRKSLDNLLITFKAPEWIKAHPKPKKSPAKMSELQSLLNKMTDEEKQMFWRASHEEAGRKRVDKFRGGGQSHD